MARLTEAQVRERVDHIVGWVRANAVVLADDAIQVTLDCKGPVVVFTVRQTHHTRVDDPMSNR